LLTDLKHAFRSLGKNPSLLALVVALSFARGVVAAEVFEEIVEQRYAVDSDATFSIRGTDGSISVYASNGAEITIRAVKKAYTSDRLKSIIVEVKAAPKGVAIDTILPPKKGLLSLEDRSGTVEYTITIPQTTRITQLELVNGEVLVEGLRGVSATAHVVNGWLIAHNCFADLDFTLVDGRLEAAYDWWDDTKFFIKLLSPEGDIRAIVPSDVSVRIIARTATGRIVNALATKEEEQGEPIRVLNFTAGATPKSSLEMNSTSGDIRIEKAY